MGYMKDSVNTEADDQYGADQTCNDESAALPDKWGMEYVFQYQTAKINNSDYQELLCKGWFLPPNTYDCGSFVVNGTAVVGKE